MTYLSEHLSAGFMQPGPGDEVVDHGKKKKDHLLSTLCTFQKEKKHPNVFSRLKLYFPDAFQVCKIALNCKLQDSFKNFMTLIKGAMSRNL